MKAKDVRAGAPPAAAMGPLLALSVFLLGAAVLVIEILGARVISPYYGSSVYAWSAQITVTLAALAAGYAAGGAWADARPRADFYFQLVAASGLLVLPIPFVKGPVLSATTGLGLMGGSIASAGVLFAPSLFLLSATGPLAIRLATAALPALGRGVGKVYALSTAGSVAGALLAGFVLVPHLSIRHTLFGTAVLLLLLGGLGFWTVRRPRAALAAAASALLIAAALLRPAEALSTNVLLHRPSYYGDVKVVDVPEGMRLLLIDGVIHGRVDKATGKGQADYLFYLEAAPLFRPGARRALLIGLGAGILPMAYHKDWGVATDAVEIDPVVAEVARSHFGFRPTGEVAVEDGRTYLERSPGGYDLVVLDAFASERAPFHLFTREFFAAAHARMAPGGVLAVNVIGNADQAAWHSIYKTIAAAFPRVRVFPTQTDPARLGNLVFLASDGPLDGPDPARAREALRPFVHKMLAQEAPPPAPEALARAVLFTDDFNPIDDLYREVMARWRRDIIRTSKSVLLYEGDK